jgi:hypothetical protein
MNMRTDASRGVSSSSLLSPARAFAPALALALPIATACAAGGDDDDDVVTCPAVDGAGDAAGVEHNAFISVDETWTAADSPHRVPNGVNFQNGATLTIEPCALVVMGAGANLTIGDTATAADIVAIGTADEPILITGSEPVAGHWDGIFTALTTSSQLEHVIVEHAGFEGNGTVNIQGVAGEEGPVLVNNVLRDGAGPGVRTLDGGRIGAGSTGNTISGMATFPIEVDFESIDSVPDGTYTGNDDDRVHIIQDGIDIPDRDLVWPALSIPWLYDGEVLFAGFSLTVSPGVHAFVRRVDETFGFEGTFRFGEGAALIADGGDDAGRIVFEDEPDAAVPSWRGFEFLDGASPSTIRFARIEGAGLMQISEDTHCVEGDAERGAILLHEDGVLTMTDTIVRDVGEGYGVDRAYFGDGAPQFTDAAANNTFGGDMICGETDQFPDPAVVANCTCLDAGCCCDHEYQCIGAPAA